MFSEPLAAAFRIIEQNVIKPDHKVAMIGDGKLGLLIAEVWDKWDGLQQGVILEKVIYGQYDYGKECEKSFWLNNKNKVNFACFDIKVK